MARSEGDSVTGEERTETAAVDEWPGSLNDRTLGYAIKTVAQQLADARCEVFSCEARLGRLQREQEQRRIRRRAMLVEHVVSLHGWHPDVAKSQSVNDPDYFQRMHRSEHGPHDYYLHTRTHHHDSTGAAIPGHAP